ncbi:hypothetical protein QO206_12365 [Leeuwenhoekiella aequorea]|uniref:hypothetical protein n=1 Tax=Leeuwenhoekiella aequorea TaxID=283736 RepID=UPI00352DC327
MKKVVLSAAALMLGTIAFAQTSTQATEADLRDNPALAGVNMDYSNITTADKLPAAAATANRGYSEQNATIPGALNDMKARQEGEMNSIVGFQTGAGNMVSMSQMGDVNGNQANSGESNLIYSTQIGQNNDGRLEQQGDLNEIILEQNNDNPPFATGGSIGNRADVQQGNNGNAEKNFAAVQQYGDDNSTRVLQSWDNSDAFVLQLGAGNAVEINQLADPENSQGHEALVEQYGENNQALVNQLADGKKGRNYARAFAYGDNNKSEQTQTTDSNTSGNVALVNQGVDTNSTPVLFNTAEYAVVTSVGAVMNGTPNTQSDYSEAIQEQAGHDNVAESHQFGAGTSTLNGDYTSQTQDGVGNEAYAFQNAYGSSNGRGNSLQTDQTGDGNYVATGQNGRNQDITVSQDGDDNYSVSTQRGNGHVADIRQMGDMNAAETAQYGVGNSIVISQDGGHSWKAEQDVPGASPNGGNSLDVIQVGPSTLLNSGLQTPAGVTRVGLTAPAQARNAGSL